jgi:hypothetical protein
MILHIELSLADCYLNLCQATLVEERYTPRMGPEIEKGWRKSSQWKALVRKHAEMVVQDRTVYPLFEKHCYADDDPDLKRCT